jgi:hypothetical protein
VNKHIKNRSINKFQVVAVSGNTIIVGSPLVLIRGVLEDIKDILLRVGKPRSLHWWPPKVNALENEKENSKQKMINVI